MSETKRVKPATPHKPSPRNVAAQSLPTDYQVDPANPYPPLGPMPEKKPKAAKGREPAAAGQSIREGSGSSAGASAAGSPPAPPELRRSHAPELAGPFETIAIAAPSPAIHSVQTTYSRDH
jgi:hypothetical protein